MKLGFILNIIASVLKWILQPVCFLWGAIESLIRGEFSEWNTDLAKAKDVYGNVLIKYPANLLLIKKSGYKFGKLFDTISKVLGMNKNLGTLKKPGLFVANTLNGIDANHVEDAINY